MMESLRHSGVVQNCYVVRDLEAACLNLNRLYGLGPFVGGETVELTNHVYRGNLGAPIVMRYAFAQSDELNIEVVQLLTTDPNAFRDMFPQGGDGLHHVAMFCVDYDAIRDRFVENGYPVASEFDLGVDGKKICFIDTRSSLGHMTELYPDHEAVRKVYRRVRELSVSWDGRELFLRRT